MTSSGIDYSELSGAVQPKRRWSRPSSAATQAGEVIIQNTKDLGQMEWLADVDSYLQGKYWLRPILLQTLRLAEDRNSFIYALLTRISAFRGANALDPAIDLLSQVNSILEQFLLGGDLANLSDDAWYVLSGALARSEANTELKMKILKDVLAGGNTHVRDGVVNALGALAIYDQSAAPEVREVLGNIAIKDPSPTVRREAADQLDDLQ